MNNADERLLAQALPSDGVGDSDPLYQATLAVEQDEALATEIAEWEAATIADGFAPGPSNRAPESRVLNL